MAGYVIHIAIAQEYLKRHLDEDYDEFINGVISPDLVKPKSISHYGKSPAYTNIKEFLDRNKLDSSFKKGCFLHLITDYLFYNKYLDSISKEIYNDYDILNEALIEKYDVILPSSVEDTVKFRSGNPKILNYKLACKIIDEISKLEIEDIAEHIDENIDDWNKYKNLT